MEKPTVFVVDDNLHSVTRLLASDGWCTPYRSAKDYLAQHAGATPGCLILDLLMPDMTGLDLQQELVRLGDEADRVSVRKRRHSDQRAGDEIWRGRLSHQAVRGQGTA